MKKLEFEKIYNKHCRFKLKSGKEIFGVVWEEKQDSNFNVFFASFADILKKKDSSRQTINLEEIIYVEPIRY